MRRLVLAALPLLLGACAFTEMTLPLPSTGLEHTIPGGRGRQVVVVKPFTDARPAKRCGMKKNGYNMDTADAVCEKDPALWFASLLADELRASGFDVLAPSDPHAPSAVVLDGVLLQLFAEPVIGAWSGSIETDLAVRIRAGSETGLVAEREFFVKGVKKGVIVGSLTPYQTSVTRAGHEAVAEIVRALLELLAAYPQLGALAPPFRLACAAGPGPLR